MAQESNQNVQLSDGEVMAALQEIEIQRREQERQQRALTHLASVAKNYLAMRRDIELLARLKTEVSTSVALLNSQLADLQAAHEQRQNELEAELAEQRVAGEKEVRIHLSELQAKETKMFAEAAAAEKTLAKAKATAEENLAQLNIEIAAASDRLAQMNADFEKQRAERVIEIRQVETKFEEFKKLHGLR